MQPTPQTSTRSSIFSFLTAASRLCLTASEFEEMQPAAVQQRIGTSFRVLRSLSAISSSSARSMFEPSLHMLEGRCGGLIARYGAIEDHGGRDAARTEAARRQ